MKLVILLILSLVAGRWVSAAFDCTLWESFSIAFAVYFLFNSLSNLGKKIIILDLPIIMAFFTWLVVPVIFYHNYTQQNYLANIWQAYMPISSDDYFSFALPGALAMALGYKIRIVNTEIVKNPKPFLNNLKQHLKGNSRIGFALLGLGIFGDILRLVAPDDLRQAVFLLQNLKYVGAFYIYFSDFKNKQVILLLAFGFLIASAVVTGMFGEFIFLSLLSLVLISLSWKRVRFVTKLAICVIGLFVILLIQNIKLDYRTRTWHGGNADAGYFGELIVDRIGNTSAMFNEKNLFFLATRMNQGLLIARTMRYVPERFPYANGETIVKSIAATVVPRFLWPDKPQAGGKYNLKRFWGYEIRGYSMNIGPIGEAYGNFGKWGGIVYMFFYGLFFNLVLSLLLKRSEKRPTLLCWIPFLFLNAIAVETDLLTTMSSLITALIFMLILMWVFKNFLRTRL